MRLYSLEGKYASALYNAANRNGNLINVEGELSKIKAAINCSAKLKSFLNDPLFRREQKRKYVHSLLSNQSYSETIQNFFKVMAENGRLGSTIKIIEDFEEIMRAHRHEVWVSITSAKELSKSQLDALTSIVKRNLASGEKPRLSVRVDSKLLGGVILEIGDKTVDLSVASCLARINKTLEDSVHQ